MRNSLLPTNQTQYLQRISKQLGVQQVQRPVRQPAPQQATYQKTH